MSKDAQVTISPCPPQISVPGPRSHVTLPDLLAATKYRVLVSAVYGAGKSVAVSATGQTGEWALRPPGPSRPQPDPGPWQVPGSQDVWALSLPEAPCTADLSGRRSGLHARPSSV